jgi:IS5 family transposase
MRRCCACTSHSNALGFPDEAIEDALYDSQAIRRFVGMDLGRESAPDATTLLKFRRLLEKHKLTASIFETINKHLASKGFVDFPVKATN